MKRRFKGLWIPAELWLCPELSVQEKCIVTEVDSLNAEDKGCFASNRYLAEFFGVSVSRMAAIIGDLNKREWLRVELANGNERTLYPGKKWIDLSHTGSSNPSLIGSDNPPLLDSVSPNKEIAKKDNKAETSASGKELFSDTDLLALSSQKSGTETGRKQTKSVVERAKREAMAEVILASYPRKSPNYARDRNATLRALKRTDYATIAQAVKDYAAYIAATKTEAKFILVAANFMDRERYAEDWVEATKFARDTAKNVPTSGQSKPEIKTIASFEDRMRGMKGGANE